MGLTALHIAASEGHSDVVQVLLQRGASVNVAAISEDLYVFAIFWY